VTRLLALETSGNGGSVALLVDGDVIERTIATAREQTHVIIEHIDGLLAEADTTLAALDGIAFGRGPGSFTGLRVATAVAQGIGLAVGTPLLPVSSLAAIAQRVWREHGAERCLACVDAHMHEVFWAPFTIGAGLPMSSAQERLSVPDAIEYRDAEPWVAAGSGFASYASELAELSGRATLVLGDAEPTARDLLPLALAALAAGQASPLEAALPAYLRREDAWRR